MASRLIWKYSAVKPKIIKSLRKRVTKATKTLHKEVIKNLDRKGWGSRIGGRGIFGKVKSFFLGGRVRYRHSSPGTTPYKQTSNLRNSIKFAVVEDKDKIIGIVWSEAPYAKTLEEGGFLQVEQNTKRHTGWRLINPIKNGIEIAPRPFFMPVVDAQKGNLRRDISSSS